MPMLISFISSNPKLDKEQLELESNYIGGIIKRVSNFNMNDLNGRMLFQKTIYLIQAFDIPLGYNFNWYLKGVYSSKLAEVGFNIKDRIDQIPFAKFSAPEYEEKFLNFLRFIEPYKQDTSMLEIFSSLHWFKKAKPGYEKDVYIDLVTQAKNIDIQLVTEGWEILHNEGIV